MHPILDADFILELARGAATAKGSHSLVNVSRFAFRESHQLQPLPPAEHSRRFQFFVRRRRDHGGQVYAVRQMVEVIEHYREFNPPCDAKAIVEGLLASVPSELLVGLRSVVLTNAAALSGRRKRGYSWSRGRKARHASEVLGLYHQKWKGDPAWIELFVDRMLEARPAWMLRLQFLRDFAFGSILYHELGHHIQATSKPEHREVETVADEWQSRLLRGHARRRHPVTGAVLRWTAPFLLPLIERTRKRQLRKQDESIGPTQH